MKRNLNKIAAAALALVMTVASAVPTFAYDTDPSDCEHSKKNATVEKDHIHETCQFCGETWDVSFTQDPETCQHFNCSYFNNQISTCQHPGYSGDYICLDCGIVLENGYEISQSEHTADEDGIISEKLATCEEAGILTARCSMCGQIYTKVYPAYGHRWSDWKTIKEATETENGEKTSTCSNCNEVRTEIIPKLGGEEAPSTNKKNNTTNKTTKPVKKAVAKVGTKFIVSGQTYKVTKVGKEVSFIAAKKHAKNVSIPATVKNKGITYKVTSIGAKAFNGNKKLTKVTIGANIAKISNNAFFKCPTLKTVTVKTMKLTKKTVGKKAFKGVNRKMVMKVPKKMKKVYAKIFKGFKVK